MIIKKKSLPTSCYEQTHTLMMEEGEMIVFDAHVTNGTIMAIVLSLYTATGRFLVDLSAAAACVCLCMCLCLRACLCACGHMCFLEMNLR